MRNKLKCWKLNSGGRSISLGRLFFLSMLVPGTATRRAFIKRQTVKRFAAFRARRNLSLSLDHVALAGNGFRRSPDRAVRESDSCRCRQRNHILRIVMRRGICERNAVACDVTNRCRRRKKARKDGGKFAVHESPWWRDQRDNAAADNNQEAHIPTIIETHGSRLFPSDASCALYYLFLCRIHYIYLSLHARGKALALHSHVKLSTYFAPSPLLLVLPTFLHFSVTLHRR